MHKHFISVYKIPLHQYMNNIYIYGIVQITVEWLANDRYKGYKKYIQHPPKPHKTPNPRRRPTKPEGGSPPYVLSNVRNSAAFFQVNYTQ